MLIDQQPFAKTKMGYISLPSNLNAIIGIKSYSCVILKMVILHDAIKQFRTGFCDLSKKKAKTCFFKKNKNGFKKNRKACELLFLNPVFFNPDCISILFCDFPLIA